ncbi:MAG: hypothetical protein R2708_07050 [Vicinamibacterales bacterium]
MRVPPSTRWAIAVAAVVSLTTPRPSPGQVSSAPPTAGTPAPLAASIDELRHVVGRWNVTTEFLRDDGSVARAVQGTYEFEWVVPDTVVRGVSHIPALDQRAAILLFVNPREKTVEMTSVGADGQLWRMIGPVGGDSRTTPDVTMPDGSTLRLRFTRSNVTADRFESRMERSVDGGRQWTTGNHQVFTRVGAGRP